MPIKLVGRPAVLPVADLDTQSPQTIGNKRANRTKLAGEGQVTF
ncbi:MAG: hypothetical protein WAL95_08135 [Candidatus Acidiferrales bacterium]